MKAARTIRVYGKVQNVGFRFYTVRAAEQNNISGFVRNEPGGFVYIEAEGDPVDLEAFTDWCHIGPKWARVERMEVQEAPEVGYRGFAIR